MNEDKTVSARDMIANYVALARKAARYWLRALLVFVVVLCAGMAYVVRRPRVYKSEASAAIHDVSAENSQPLGSDEAQSQLHAQLDQVYGSRANLGRVVDELHLYPWLQGRTSRMKIIEGFQDAVTYAGTGRDGLHLEFLYKDPATAQRVVGRLLTLYTEERRSAGQVQVRNDLASVNTALAALETVLSTQEERLERFEHANHDMVEQVRLRRLGQMQARAGLPVGGVEPAAVAPIASNLDDSSPTRRLRIRLAALQGREAALERALVAPAAAPAPVVEHAPVEESERLQTLRHNVADLRDRLARLRTTYTDQYPDVRIAIQRLADAERDLQAGIAAEQHPHAVAAAVAPTVDHEQLRSELESIEREAESTRAALAAASRDDHAHAAPQPVPSAPAAVAPAAPPQPNLIGPDDLVAGGHSIESPLGNLVEVESAWDRLTSELNTTRTRYQTLLSRKFELQAQLDTVNTTGADVLRVIDPPTFAVDPEPPGRTKLAMIAFAMAFVLALGVAGLSGFLDGRLYEPADLRRWGELPELPVIPDLELERDPLITPSSPGPERAVSNASGTL